LNYFCGLVWNFSNVSLVYELVNGLISVVDRSSNLNVWYICIYYKHKCYIYVFLNFSRIYQCTIAIMHRDQLWYCDWYAKQFQYNIIKYYISILCFWYCRLELRSFSKVSLFARFVYNICIYYFKLNNSLTFDCKITKMLIYRLHNKW
jgi:hypothetical protein